MQCYFCPITCELGEGEEGLCGAIRRSDGTLHRVYHNFDIEECNIEKTGFYHLFPGHKCLFIRTSHCNLFCTFCPEHKVVYTYSQRISRNVVKESILRRCNMEIKVLVFSCNSILDLELIKELKEEKQITIACKSHGFINERILTNFLESIDAILIRFLGFSKKTYAKFSISPHAITYVAKTAELAVNLGKHVEFEFYIIPGVTTEKEFLNFIDFLQTLTSNAILHLRRFYPNFYELERAPTRTEELMKYFKLAKEHVHYVYADLWYSEANDTLCPNGHIIIKRFAWKIIGTKLKGNRCAICGAEIPLMI